MNNACRLGSILFYCVLVSLLIILVALSASAQSGSGATHPAKAGGAPGGTYALGGLDSVNLYNGHLNVNVPLLTISGRGGTSFTLQVPLQNHKWSVHSSPWDNGDGTGIHYVNTAMGTPMVMANVSDIYGAGHLEARTLLTNPSMCFGATLTRVYWTTPDGTEVEMRDLPSDGQPHESNNCSPPFSGPFDWGRNFRAADGSAISFVSDEDIIDKIETPPFATPFGGIVNASGTLIMRDGSRYRYVDGLLRKIIDRNGNTISFNYADACGNCGWLRLTGIADSLGRQVTITYGDRNASQWSDRIDYQGGGGTTRSLYVMFTPLGQALRPDQTLKTTGQLFPLINQGHNAQNDGGPLYDPMVVSAIVLPDSRQFQISYNSYVEVARITTPTGSRIEYDHRGLNQVNAPGYTVPDDTGVLQISDETAEIQRRVSQCRTYSSPSQLETTTTISDIGMLNPVVVSHLDRNGVSILASEKHYFFTYNLFGQGLIIYFWWKTNREFRTEMLDENGQILRAVDYNWQQRAPWPPSGNMVLTEEPANDPRVADVTTTLFDTNQVSKRTFSYDQYNNLTEVREFELGSGAPGPLSRVSQTDYLTVNPVNGTDYTNSNLHVLNLVAQHRVYDGNQTLQARTDNEYDNYNDDGSNKPLTPRDGITGLETAYATTSYLTRGNLTKTTRLLDLVTNQGPRNFLRYDIAGNVVSVKDPLNHVSQFGYADSFSDSVNRNTYAYPTSITSPIPDPQGTHGSNTSLIATAIYDFHTGAQVSSIDANGQVTTIEYNDIFDRPRRVVRALGGGETSFEYGDTPSNLFVRKLTKQDATRSIETRSYFDGFGRATRLLLYEGPAADTWLAKDIQYDALGRNSATSNGYRVNSPSPTISACGLCTTKTYDSLGRIRILTRPDGSQVHLSYQGNTSTLIDQEGKTRKIVKDVFGRVALTIEDPNGTSLQTIYTYDVLGNVRKITQGGQQRFFMYDPLSRLIRIKNPEEQTNSTLPAATDPISGNNGWSSAYTYDDFNNLASAINPRNVIATFNYDALNRNTGITYTNESAATPNINRYYDGWRDGAFINIPNVKGRLWQTETSGASASRTTIDSFDALGGPLIMRQQFFSNGTWGGSYLVQRTYNLAGAVTMQWYPSGHTVSYSYDDAGRTANFSGTLGDNVTRAYSSAINYSTFGSIAHEQYGTDTPVYNKRFYNSRGQLAEIRESTSYTGPTDTTWNRGAIINHYSNNCWGTCAGQNMTDNNGNLKKQEVYIPVDDQVSSYTTWWQRYDYDQLNRLQRVHEFTGNTQTEWQQEYVYDSYGNRTINTNSSATWGAGISSLGFEVDTATNRLYAPGDLALPDTSRRMQYDASGNQSRDSYTGQGQRSYDAENRMTQAWANNQWQTYTYNAIGQRVRRKVNGIETWQVYGIHGELLAEYAATAVATLPQKEYGYRNGQLLVVATGGAGWGAPPELHDNPLQIGVTTVQARHITELRDAINGIRMHVGMTAFSWQQPAGPGNLIKADPILEMRTALNEVLGAPPQGYSAGLAQGLPIKAIHVQELRDRVLTAWSSGSSLQINWLVADQLGTPRMIFDKTGSLANVKRHDYLPFGEELFAGQGARTPVLGYGASEGIRQKFTQYERDGETGLDFAQARYYSSAQGRFASPDSFGGSQLNPQTLNLYSYVNNNPLRSVDPTGHWTFDVTAAFPLGQEGKPPPPPPPSTGMLVDIGELIRQGKLVRGTITITQLGIAEDDAGLADAQKWVAGRTLGMSEFAFAFLQMEPEGEEAESEEAREEEEKADEQRDFELEPWRNPNAIPPVEIDPLYEDPAMALEEEYASMVPDLEGETDGARLANAVRSVSSMEGTPEEKAETMRQYAAQIRLRSGGSWEYDTGRGTDGSYVFIGSAGYKPTHVVVISPQGNVYTGGYTGFTFSGSGVTPRYDILRPAPK